MVLFRTLGKTMEYGIQVVKTGTLSAVFTHTAEPVLKFCNPGISCNHVAIFDEDCIPSWGVDIMSEDGLKTELLMAELARTAKAIVGYGPEVLDFVENYHDILLDKIPDCGYDWALRMVELHPEGLLLRYSQCCAILVPIPKGSGLAIRIQLSRRDNDYRTYYVDWHQEKSNTYCVARLVQESGRTLWEPVLEFGFDPTKPETATIRCCYDIEDGRILMNWSYPKTAEGYEKIRSRQGDSYVFCCY